MTQSITLTRPAIKSQLKRFLNNVLRSEDEGYLVCHFKSEGCV